MKSFFMKVKEKMRGPSSDLEIPDETDEGYVELATDKSHLDRSKISIRPFVLEEFAGVKPILDSLREGYTIALINIKPLKDVDLSELKRAINKLKKTCDALEGDIAGFGEDWICVTPSFAQIHRETKVAQPRGPSAPGQGRDDDMDGF